MNPVSIAINSFLSESNRWFLWVPVLIIGGIALYFNLPYEPPLWWVIASPIFIIFLFFFRNKEIYRFLFSFALAVAIGFNAAQIETKITQTPLLDETLPPVSITGHLMRAEMLPEGSRLTIHRPYIKGFDQSERFELVRIKVRTPFSDLPDPGTRVNVWGPLWPPSSPVAPNDYDFRRHAFFKQIGATGLSYGELRERESRYPLPFFWDGFFVQIEKARQFFIILAASTLPNASVAGMTAALLSGSQTGIDRETMEAMRISGLSHLLSISGVHVSMMAFLVYVPLRFLLALIPWLALRYSIKKWAAFASIFSTAFYTLLVGADAPTVRSALMTSIVLFAIIVDRKSMSMRLLALAAIAISIIAPHSVMGPSFQMSFAAVLVMVAAYENRLDDALKFGLLFNPPEWIRKIFYHLRDIATTSLLATIATAPFTLFHFHTFSFYGVLANMIAIPLTTLWIMPCLLLTYLTAPFDAANWFVYGAGWGVEQIIALAKEVAAWPYAQLFLPPMPPVALLSITLGGLWVCLWKGSWRYLGLLPAIGGYIYPLFAVLPSVYIAETAPVWAVLLSDGKMAAYGKREEDFTIHQWRQRTLNPDTLFFNKRHLPDLGEELTCDEEFCAFEKNGKTIIFLHPGASQGTVEKACKRPDLILVAYTELVKCGAQITIDLKDLKTKGAHTISFLKNNEIQVDYTRQKTGQRPWSTGWSKTTDDGSLFNNDERARQAAPVP